MALIPCAESSGAIVKRTTIGYNFPNELPGDDGQGVFFFVSSPTAQPTFYPNVAVNEVKLFPSTDCDCESFVCFVCAVCRIFFCL